MMMMMTIYKVQIGSCCNSMLIALRKKKRKKGEKKKTNRKALVPSLTKAYSLRTGRTSGFS